MKTPTPTISSGRYPSGKNYWIVSCALPGGRYRKKHACERDAHADRTRLIHSAASGLTAQEHVATEHVVHVLKNSENADACEKDVLFAVEWFCRHYVNPARLKPIRAYYEEFLSIKRAQGRRPDTIKEIERILGSFVNDFELSDVNRLGFADIEPWIIENSRGPRSHRRVFHMVKHFFGYLCGRSKMTPNPHPILKESPFNGRNVIFQDDECDDETDIIVFTAEECERLIAEAQRFNAQRMFVWLLFTGMRPQESVRFWSDARWGWNLISDDLRFIRVPRAISKTRRSRMIEVSPTLRSWLEHYRGFPSLMTGNWRDKYCSVRKKVLPPEKLKPDIARHTLISMMIKQGKGWAEIELQMGNKKDVQMRHYASLVSSEAEVERYFALMPDRFENDLSEEDYRKVAYGRQLRGFQPV